ncbi:MAG: Trk family potassium uptake protein [Clostridiales bacterium]|nr:Trk family potassium uptake protein [Clostridiales bacterium]
MAGFAIADLIGALLLALPVADRTGRSCGFINALFTSTAALSATGLSVMPSYASWSVLGQTIVIGLVQIGGIGFVTMLGVVFLFTGQQITLKERLIIQESLNQNHLQGMVQLVKNIGFGTLLIEGAAAAVLTARFAASSPSLMHAAGLGVFQSISSFCSAGIDVLGDSSLTKYVSDPIINLVIMALIIAGSLGFTVGLDLLRVYRGSARKRQTLTAAYRHLKLHTKIVLEMTAVLILFGALFFFAAEYSNPASFGALSPPAKIWAAFFQSVSARTAGYYTVAPENLTMSSQFFILLLMFVGGPPVGTAGGVKTVTLFIIVISALSVIRGRNIIISHNRQIHLGVLQGALAVVIVSVVIVITGTMLLSVTEKHMTGFQPQFMDFLFEIVAGVSTAGMTMGMTPYLSPAGKLILCACMFLGRVGPVTVAISLAAQQMRADLGVHYPEETVIIS